MVYLDHAAGSPLRPGLGQELAQLYHRYPANPSSQHRLGRLASEHLEESRLRLKALLGAEPEDDLVLVSGGTEANFLALMGLLRRPGHVLLGSIEHASVRELAPALQERGFEVEWLGVDKCGRYCAAELGARLRRDTRLVSLGLVNNELGVIQELAPLVDLAREAGAFFHTDAVQAVGKMPVDFTQLRVDALTFSAHKFQGPRGVGGVLLRRGVQYSAPMPGGGQQRGARGGTENVAGVSVTATALQRALETPLTEELGRNFLAELRELEDWSLLGGAPRLSGHYCLLLQGCRAEAVVLGMERAGYAISSGSACSYHSQGPSPVLQAMGLGREQARSAVRVSFGSGNSPEQATEAGRALAGVVEALRKRAVTACV